jgi:hypothetical protein
VLSTEGHEKTKKKLVEFTDYCNYHVAVVPRTCVSERRGQDSLPRTIWRILEILSEGRMMGWTTFYTVLQRWNASILAAELRGNLKNFCLREEGCAIIVKAGYYCH